MKPEVEIAIPVYNGEKYIRECIESVLAQRNANIRILISDNKSTDNTLSIIKSFNDPRITIFEQTSNIGGHENFNFLIKQSTAPFVKLFCADDVMMPWATERQMKLLEEFPEAVVCSSGMIITDENLTPTSQENFALGLYTRQQLVNLCCKGISNFLGGPSNFLFRGEILRRLYFDSNFKYLSDLIMCLEACNFGYFINEGYPSYFYRRHSHSDTNLSCPPKLQNQEWAKFISLFDSSKCLSLKFISKHHPDVLIRKESAKILLRFKYKKIISKIFNKFKF